MHFYIPDASTFLRATAQPYPISGHLSLSYAIRSHQGPLIVPRVSSFAQSGPVTTSVYVALIGLEVQDFVLGHS